MGENLKKLYNTLLLVETKGESTKIMAECLRFTEGMINESEREKLDAMINEEEKNSVEGNN